MDKYQLSERDICTKFITPALGKAGWDIATQVREEFPLTKGRKTTENAWKISAADIAARNYNLDCKNPHAVEVNHCAPADLMAEYQEISRQLTEAQAALKAELMQALGGNT